MNWRGRAPLLRRALLAAFLLAAAALLWRYARIVDWHQVGVAIAGYPPARLILAAGVAVLAYAAYASFDVLARAYTGHTLPLSRVLPIAFICYAFNLNLGAVVGGIGFRYRLYSQSGLGIATISRVVAFTIASNWSGFLLLGGLALLLNPLPLPGEWANAMNGLRLAGTVMLATVATWLAMSVFSRRRRWSVRGHEIELPSLPIALLQVSLASLSWLAIAAILFLLMPEGVPYPTVAGVLVLSVLANLVIRVPANLGVLEAVFVGVLGGQFGAPAILAAVLTYRAVFHIGPLLIALATYAVFEARRR